MTHAYISLSRGSEQFIEKLKAVIEQRQTLEQTKEYYRTQRAY
jgi:hypothetical protein